MSSVHVFDSSVLDFTDTSALKVFNSVLVLFDFVLFSDKEFLEGLEFLPEFFLLIVGTVLMFD